VSWKFHRQRIDEWGGRSISTAPAIGWKNCSRPAFFLKDEVEARDTAIAATKKTMRINSLEIETVTLKDGVIHPDRIRERIRADGPTAPRFDRQHLDKDRPCIDMTSSTRRLCASEPRSSATR